MSDTEPKRLNPFPAFSDTEYELFMATIRHEARCGAEAAISAHLSGFCEEHRQRTEALEAVVFGRAERGILGLDSRTLAMEHVIVEWEDERKWFKRMLYGALTVAVFGLIITVTQILIVGK
jgi:hypothetical protein